MIDASSFVNALYAHASSVWEQTSPIIVKGRVMRKQNGVACELYSGDDISGMIYWMTPGAQHRIEALTSEASAECSILILRPEHTGIIL